MVDGSMKRKRDSRESTPDLVEDGQRPPTRKTQIRGSGVALKNRTGGEGDAKDEELNEDFIAFDDDACDDFAPTVTGSLRAPQLQEYSLYCLEDVDTLLSLYGAEISRFYSTHDGVNYAGWIQDDIKVKLVRKLLHDHDNLERQKDFLESRAGVLRRVFWPDLVDREVRKPVTFAYGLNKNDPDYIMDVKDGIGMPKGVWSSFHTEFKTETLEGAKLGYPCLLEQIEVLKKSPLEYQERGINGDEKKSVLFREFEAKIGRLKSRIEDLTREATWAVKANLTNGGVASQSATAGISVTPSACNGSGSAAEVHSTPTNTGDAAANKLPGVREPIKNLKRKASPPPNAPTGPRAMKKQRIE